MDDERLDPGFSTDPKRLLPDPEYTHSKRPRPTPEHDNEINAVVRLVSIAYKRSSKSPWKTQNYGIIFCTGFAIEGRRILTVAHGVESAVKVTVKKRHCLTDFTAKVVGADFQTDLAILEVSDPKFWEGMTFIKLGDFPDLGSEVTVFGFPSRYKSPRFTKGLISMVDVCPTTRSTIPLLVYETYAASETGISGGPALDEGGRCVGILCWVLLPKLESTFSVSCLVPVPSIESFLKRYKNEWEQNEVLGVPVIGVMWQELTNPDLRESLGMTEHETGVVKSRHSSYAKGWEEVRAGDVISSIDEYPVSNEGTYLYCGHILPIQHYFAVKCSGDTVNLKVIRESQHEPAKVTIHNPVVQDLAHFNVKKPPSYFIKGGFVFTTVSVEYLVDKYGKEFLNHSSDIVKE